MSEEKNIFDSLNRLARLAPAPPAVGALRARLRRRTIKRSLSAVAAAVVVIVVAAVWVAQPPQMLHVQPLEPDTAPLANKPKAVPPQPDKPEEEGADPRPPTEPAPIVIDVEPLPRDALPAEIRSALRLYFSSKGITRALLEKTPENGISWSVVATKKLVESSFQAELEVLLSNSDYAEIDFKPESISYTLLSYTTNPY
ncbi:MAG: hypothetical protein L3J82_05940 [Planctomycetes bacterium]|nr:hypothetical protein [Planctomycetota bacterium]